MELANALRSATQAQSVSTARRTTIEKDFADKVEKAVDSVAGVKGLTTPDGRRHQGADPWGAPE